MDSLRHQLVDYEEKVRYLQQQVSLFFMFSGVHFLIVLSNLIKFSIGSNSEEFEQSRYTFFYKHNAYKHIQDQMLENCSII